MSTNYLKSILKIMVLFLTMIGLNHCLLAQTYFPLGIWNYDVTGPEYRVWYANEMNLIQNINAIYLAQMSYHAQEGMIDSCTTRFAGAVRTELVHDTTGDYYPLPTEPYNPTFWRYISGNDAADIDSAHVEQFINNIASCYDYINDPGLGAIRVAHQGQMDQADHWPYIQYACHLISVNPNLGGYVQSVAVHNVFHWNDGDTTSLENFFRQVNSLDVYQHEYYPFFRSHQRRTVGIQFPPYYGNDYQTTIIDQRLLATYDQTRRALARSGNKHTTLEVIIQTCSQLTPESDTTYFRRPTEAEIWMQAFLALGRGYKGVHTYVYRTVPYTGYFVPFDSGLVASTTPPTARTAIGPYNQVAQLYNHLAELGDDILPLTVLDAFTWTGAAHSYITDIIDDVDDGGHGTIEISLMDDPTPGNNYDYFLLVNRRCSSDNNGTPAAPQTITVRTNKTGQYQIQDLYSGELFVSSDGYFRNIVIDPGHGRLFELRPMFVNNENWANTINVSSNINVPSGKTLTISPNSTVKFYSGKYLQVQGKLTANGTTTQHIKFTSAAAAPARGNWKWIKEAA